MGTGTLSEGGQQDANGMPPSDKDYVGPAADALCIFALAYHELLYTDGLPYESLFDMSEDVYIQTQAFSRCALPLAARGLDPSAWLGAGPSGRPRATERVSRELGARRSSEADCTACGRTSLARPSSRASPGRFSTCPPRGESEISCIRDVLALQRVHPTAAPPRHLDASFRPRAEGCAKGRQRSDAPPAGRLLVPRLLVLCPHHLGHLWRRFEADLEDWKPGGDLRWFKGGI